VSPDSLREAGLVRSKRLPIKVLGRGEITKALTVQAHKFSGKAAVKLAAVGGKAEALATPAAEATDAGAA
jgi:large subunit ribosomal protein L15